MMDVLRFHSGWMEVANPSVCVCVCVVFPKAQQWERLTKAYRQSNHGMIFPKTEMAQMVTGMYGGEWWMMHHNDKHQQQTFFPVNLRLSTAWIPNQTSLRHILKSRIRKKNERPCRVWQGNKNYDTYGLLVPCSTANHGLKGGGYCKCFDPSRVDVPNRTKIRGLSELQKCTCDMKTSNTSRRHVNSTQL